MEGASTLGQSPGDSLRDSALFAGEVGVFASAAAGLRIAVEHPQEVGMEGRRSMEGARRAAIAAAAGLLAVLGAAGCAVEPEQGAIAEDEDTASPALAPAPAERGVRSPESRLASLRGRSAAHVVVTAARSRVVAEFPGVVIDCELEARSVLLGDPPPATVTVPGGAAGGVIAEAFGAPHLEPGRHYIALFDSVPSGAPALTAALPATTAGEVIMDGRTVAPGEMAALLAQELER